MLYCNFFPDYGAPDFISKTILGRKCILETVANNYHEDLVNQEVWLFFFFGLVLSTPYDQWKILNGCQQIITTAQQFRTKSANLLHYLTTSKQNIKIT